MRHRFLVFLVRRILSVREGEPSKLFSFFYFLLFPSHLFDQEVGLRFNSLTRTITLNKKAFSYEFLAQITDKNLDGRYFQLLHEPKSGMVTLKLLKEDEIFLVK